MEAVEEKIQLEKYASYKDSGVEWIGEIPEHWELKKLKHIFYEKKHATNTNLNCGSISFGKVVTKDDEKIPLSTKLSYQEVLNGEFLINPLNLNYDLISLRIALSYIDVVVSPGYIVLKNSTVIEKNFFNYLLHRYDVAYMKLLGSGVRQTINFNHIANSLLVFPPLFEQTVIAHFLDDKIAKIDKAINIKERQIELLKERRQILIHKAVTQGLNPNVKMKDSGVDWIGLIPVHWEVITNRALFYETNVPGNDTLPLLSVSIHTAVSSAELDDEANIRGKIKIENKSAYKLVEINDIVFNMMRAWQGAIGCVKTKGMVSPAYVVAKPNNSIDPLYFEYQYRTNSFIQQMDIASKGITDFRKRLYWYEFKQLLTILPPLKEQILIVSYINGIFLKTDSVISLKEKEIGKLKEYKATLIDSAVTGKIKIC